MANDPKLMPATDSSSANRPRVGLALSGGAARGVAHVGVLRAFEEHQIPIDAIAGASAGSLIGGAYASGLPVEELEKMARNFRRSEERRVGTECRWRLWAEHTI